MRSAFAPLALKTLSSPVRSELAPFKLARWLKFKSQLICFLSGEEDVDDSEDESLGSHRTSGCCFARGCGLRDLDGDSARQIPMGRVSLHVTHFSVNI